MFQQFCYFFDRLGTQGNIYGITMQLIPNKMQLYIRYWTFKLINIK